MHVQIATKSFRDLKLPSEKAQKRLNLKLVTFFLVLFQPSNPWEAFFFILDMHIYISFDEHFQNVIFADTQWRTFSCMICTQNPRLGFLLHGQ